MNVVVDYPEDFPLVGIDRKVFGQRRPQEAGNECI